MGSDKPELSDICNLTALADYNWSLRQLCRQAALTMQCHDTAEDHRCRLYIARNNRMITRSVRTLVSVASDPSQ